MNVMYAFLRRDFLEALTYKYSFVSALVGILLSSATFFFVSKLITPGSQALSPYGGEYFSFVIIGLAFSGMFGIFQEGLPSVIRSAQLSGTLEALLITRCSAETVLLGSSLYPLIFQSVRMIVHLVIAALFFGMKIGQVNWGALLVIFLLACLTFISLGMISASFILVYKMGNPISWLFGSLSGLLGGVLFPVSVLPVWLSYVSKILPITYALDGLRRSLLVGASWQMVKQNVIALAFFNLILFPAGIILYRAALRKARKDGTLTHY